MVIMKGRHILNPEHPEITAVEVAWEGDSLEAMRSFPGPVGRTWALS
jgi:hypothetical protein